MTNKQGAILKPAVVPVHALEASSSYNTIGPHSVPGGPMPGDAQQRGCVRSYDIRCIGPITSGSASQNTKD